TKGFARFSRFSGFSGFTGFCDYKSLCEPCEPREPRESGEPETVIRIRTIDAHAAGEPLRLIVDGFPAPQGRTMLEKREWVKKKHDHLRRALMLEPRGPA